MLRIVLSMAACAAPVHASGRQDVGQLLTQGVVAMPYQERFGACTSAPSGKTSLVAMHGDGRVLLYAGREWPASQTDRAIATFEGCLRRFGQQR